MKTIIGKVISYFAVLSVVIGIIQIVRGQTEYNSIIVGLANSYLYFTIGLIMLGLAKIVELLNDIRNAIDRRE